MKPNPANIFLRDATDWLNALFPFHMSFDPALCLCGVGDAIGKLIGEHSIGKEFGQIISLERPRGSMSYEWLCGKSGKAFAAEFCGNGFRYRGQLFAINDALIMLGSPQFESADQMLQTTVLATDFAAMDLSLDLMMMKEAHQVQLQDRKVLTEQLSAAAARQKELAEIENRLEHELNNAADIRIRLTPNHCIESINAVRDDLLPLPAENLVFQNVEEAFPAIQFDERIDALNKTSPLAFEFSQPLNDGRTLEFDVRLTRSLNGGFLLLLHDETANKLALKAQKQLQKELELSAHKAGMAEVASGVLHNIGNVLNSVNISAKILGEKLQVKEVDMLKGICNAIAKHDDPMEFFRSKERILHLPNFLTQIQLALEKTRNTSLDELEMLIKNIDHIKEIVSMQQSLATFGSRERVEGAELLEDALKLNREHITRNDVNVIQDFENSNEILTEKHRVLQILINLVKNSIQAIQENDAKRELYVSCKRYGAYVRFTVRDTGIGIPKNVLEKIFQYGFTTKKSGHGFGLHASANTAQELGGKLQVESDGVGKGAVFMLDLPCFEHNKNTDVNSVRESAAAI